MATGSPPSSLDDLASLLRRFDREDRAARLVVEATREFEDDVWREALAHPVLRSIPTHEVRVVAHELVQEDEVAALAALEDADLASMTGPAGSFTVAHEAVYWHREAARQVLARPAIRTLRDDDGWSLLAFAVTHHPDEVVLQALEATDCEPDLIAELLSLRNLHAPFIKKVTEAVAEGRIPVADWAPEAQASLLARHDCRLRREVMLAMGGRAQEEDRKGESPAPNPSRSDSP